MAKPDDPDPFYKSALISWQALSDATVLASEMAGRKRSRDDQVCSNQYEALIATALVPVVVCTIMPKQNLKPPEIGKPDIG